MQHRYPTALSLIGILGFWFVLAWFADDATRLPGPVAVAGLIVEEAASGRLWTHLSATLERVVWAFGLAMVFGSALGLLLGRLPALDRWVDPVVVLALNLPALVVIVLFYIWIGLNEVAAIAAVAFNKFALVLVTVRDGARAFDPRLDEMARVYRLSLMARIRHVYVPQLVPFLSSSARNGLAIIWKLVLVVEFLGRPDGVGFQIHLRFQLFDIAGVLAYSGAFILIMLCVEYLLLQPVERRIRVWRTA